MKFSFDILRATRNNILKDIEGLSLEQWNVIPTGFHNNIVWNIAHLVATQQLLVYGLSGTSFVVGQDLIDAYRKGTKPEQPATQDQVEVYKKLFLTTIDHTEQDYDNGIFGTQFKTYTTSYNITLTTLENAIEFNNVHEGVHYGIIRALRRAV